MIPAKYGYGNYFRRMTPATGEHSEIINRLCKRGENAMKLDESVGIPVNCGDKW